MKYSHIKQPGLLLILLLTGVIPYLYHSQPGPGLHPVSVAYASHGLRAYVDPDTGLYGRPPEQAADVIEKSFSAQAMISEPPAVTLSEQVSGKSGGGYTIDLRERFRPSRKGP